MSKIWKERPPGPEQIELERMFRENEIDARAAPDSVKKRKDLFREFSSSVFANHFRKTKAKLGLSANVSNAYAGSSCIQELGGLNGFFESENDRPCVTPTETVAHFSQPAESVITHSNAPCWTWVYTDHEKKKDFVCVTIPALCGKKAKFTIAEDGTHINIRYEWPDVMFKAGSLFEKSKTADGAKLSLGHPKVHAFVSHLLESGVTDKSTLHTEVTVQLPRKIQRENDTWSMEKVLVGDTKMIHLQFSAFQKTLIINDADTSLDF